MATPELTVKVSIHTLEAWQAALNSSYHQNLVLDLADYYRRLKDNGEPSAITKALGRALDEIKVYINDTVDEDTDETPEGPNE